ncbi:ABC transporter permease [Anaerocolumna xylanovorans]|uniref:ABC-2 type transport system permease protein n=1 Tax=Anaerocolumna xylanovorans DSM 12503 TaxID=1121345 RepID=A0A1M7YD33_9FIRM|nr:ABC transporter permease [Anaerocolumna xylanovorans]SHO50544.1 ABC-2 type transport system permease protein [Anaerocolumna xylanovorans DSM 12503]
MSFSIKRVRALTIKEFKSFTKNSNVLLMSLLPILFSILYTYIYGGKAEDVPKTDIFMLCLNMNLSMVASFVIGMLIAEEKEKNTLRTLLLSGVSSMEFLTGKVTVTLLITVITNIIMFFITGMETQYLGWFLFFSLLVIISMIIIGAIIGMISPSQMSTGVIGLPVIMLFLLIPMLAEYNDNLKKVAKFTPNYNMNLLLKQTFKGEALSSADLPALATIAVWIVLTAILFAFTYSKIGIDK